MKKSTKKAVLIGGVAAVAAVLGYEYWKSKQTPTPTVPSAPTPGGLPTATLTPGQVYTIGATVPTGVADAASLVTALKAAGWSSVGVITFTAGAAYTAQATWGGAAGAPVPTGVLVTVGAIPGVSFIATG